MIRSTVTRLRSSAGLKVAAAGAAAAAAASFAMPAAECQSKDGAYVEIRSSIFVINGFYMAMREKYTKPSASIYYYLVEWDPAKLSWGDFREKVLGGTDPAMAADGSARESYSLRATRESYSLLRLHPASPRRRQGDLRKVESARPLVRAERRRQRDARVRLPLRGDGGAT